ncbi:hypothetical protein ADL27_02445 [Streptomyces sp. NRRL F-6602]|nr:hypothetical protein ADL27_02445 [Streptomyces sp. NRRL F-6602]
MVGYCGGGQAQRRDTLMIDGGFPATGVVVTSRRGICPQPEHVVRSRSSAARAEARAGSGAVTVPLLRAARAPARRARHPDRRRPLTLHRALTGPRTARVTRDTDRHTAHDPAPPRNCR